MSGEKETEDWKRGVDVSKFVDHELIITIYSMVWNVDHEFVKIIVHYRHQIMTGNSIGLA